MLSENSVIYRFLCILWVLITMVPRNRRKEEKKYFEGSATCPVSRTWTSGELLPRRTKQPTHRYLKCCKTSQSFTRSSESAIHQRRLCAGIS